MVKNHFIRNNAQGNRPRALILLLVTFAFLSGCSGNIWNSPYLSESDEKSVLYTSFSSPPKHLDPVVSYNSNEWQFNSQIYEPVIQYHYFKKPYTIEPLTLTALPEVTYLDEAGLVTSDENLAVYSEYRFRLKPNIQYQPHPAFSKNASGKYLYHALNEADLEGIDTPLDFKEQGSRALIADDYIYAIKRMALRANHSPVLDTMADYIVGLSEFSEQLGKQKESEVDLVALEIEGVKPISDHEFTIRIKGRYPQFVYWLSMNFFAPIPHEAISFYNQPLLKERNMSIDTYPVGTGPYMMAEHNPNKIIRLVKNPNYRFDPFPQVPDGMDASDFKDVGKAMPFIDEVRYSLEKESIPLWNKFLQGFYDASGVSSDSFEQAINVGAGGALTLTAEMEAKNINFLNAVKPTSYYFAFNMEDPVVGGYTEEKQKLRQALSIALNFEEFISIFMNGRGIAAQGPIPPGLYGYEPSQAGVNPFIYDWKNGQAVRKSIEVAKQLLAEAGYPNGQKDGEPLKLYFDSASTGPDAQSQLNWYRKQFAKLGIELVIRATDYNRFQKKVRGAKTQMFMWGWNADYPDPENFLFLLAGENASINTNGSGVNSANYDRKEFNDLYAQMKAISNGEARLKMLKKMVEMVQRDAPWAWGFHPKDLVLYHGWYHNVYPNAMVNNGLKYKRLDETQRAQAQQAWNQPIVWPLWLVLLGVIVSIYPLWRAYQKRQNESVQIGKG